MKLELSLWLWHQLKFILLVLNFGYCTPFLGSIMRNSWGLPVLLSNTANTLISIWEKSIMLWLCKEESCWKTDIKQTILHRRLLHQHGDSLCNVARVSPSFCALRIWDQFFSAFSAPASVVHELITVTCWKLCVIDIMAAVAYKKKCRQHSQEYFEYLWIHYFLNQWNCAIMLYVKEVSVMML